MRFGWENGRVKPHGHTRGWDAWPADIRSVLYAWNRLGLVRFERRSGPFKCRCGELCAPNPNGDVTTITAVLCDDCAILLLRRYIAQADDDPAWNFPHLVRAAES